MAENSKIEWCDHTFNPWIGCQKVSDACDNCYAETWDKRYGGNRWGAHAPRTRTSPLNWRQPLKWNKEAEAKGMRYRVFCASLADVFDNHTSITSGWHGDLWALIEATPHLDWLLLTKRPQNIKKMLPEEYGLTPWGEGWSNVWLGVTVENQIEANRRIPILLDVPAKVHFLSCEPLLENLDLWEWLPDRALHEVGGVGWVICGGESGANARPMHPDWARSVRDQCKSAGVPFFFKQWGEWAPGLHGRRPGTKQGPKVHFWRETDDFMTSTVSTKIGKHRAGRLLDGVEHNEFSVISRS